MASKETRVIPDRLDIKVIRDLQALLVLLVLKDLKAAWA